MSIYDPTADELREGLNVAMGTFPAGWERDSLARRVANMLAARRADAANEPQKPKPIVRVTIEYKNGRDTKMVEFADIAEADSFVVADSYFTEPYVKKMTWERLA